MIPPRIEEVFLDLGGGAGLYRPALLGQAELHYTKRGTELDHWREVWCLAGLADRLPADPWSDASALAERPELAEEPATDAGFSALPSGAADPAAYGSLARRFESWLYREQKLRLWSCRRVDLLSEPGETEPEFTIRVRDAARERRDAEVEKLRDAYATKLKRLEDRIDTAEDRVAREASHYEQQRNQGLLRLGSTVLGAFLGRKTISKANLNKLSTAANTFGRASKQKEDVDLAEEKVESLRTELAALERELEAEMAELRDAWAPDSLALEEVEIAPRKSDIGVQRVALAWVRGSGSRPDVG